MDDLPDDLYVRQFLSIVVITYDYYVGMLYKRGYEYLWIIIASILEPIFYHPIITFCSLRGYLSYLTNRDFKWKNMERKGFKQKEESADGTDITAMKARTCYDLNKKERLKTR